MESPNLLPDAQMSAPETHDESDSARVFERIANLRWRPELRSGLWPIAVRPAAFSIAALAARPAIALFAPGLAPASLVLEAILAVIALLAWAVAAHHALVLKTTHYRIETGPGWGATLIAARGVLSRTETHLELMRIRDVTYEAPLWQRLVGCAHLRIDSNDPSDPVLFVNGQADARAKLDILKAGMRAQQRELGYREGLIG